MSEELRQYNTHEKLGVKIELSDQLQVDKKTGAYYLWIYQKAAIGESPKLLGRIFYDVFQGLWTLNPDDLENAARAKHRNTLGGDQILEQAIAMANAQNHYLKERVVGVPRSEQALASLKNATEAPENVEIQALAYEFATMFCEELPTAYIADIQPSLKAIDTKNDGKEGALEMSEKGLQIKLLVTPERTDTLSISKESNQARFKLSAESARRLAEYTVAKNKARTASLVKREVRASAHEVFEFEAPPTPTFKFGQVRKWRPSDPLSMRVFVPDARGAKREDIPLDGKLVYEDGKWTYDPKDLPNDHFQYSTGIIFGGSDTGKKILDKAVQEANKKLPNPRESDQI